MRTRSKKSVSDEQMCIGVVFGAADDDDHENCLLKGHVAQLLICFCLQSSESFELLRVLSVLPVLCAEPRCSMI